ncbi:MAG: tyrosine-type recombinase/integrase [Polyangiales bacterium]
MRALRSQAHEAELKGAFDAPTELTFGAWGEKWMERRAQRVASPIKDRSPWRNYIANSALYLMPLRAIRPPHVVEWLDALEAGRGVKGRRLSRQSLLHIVNLVRMCLGDARRAGHIDLNPAQDIRPRRRDPKREVVYLTVDEIRAVRDCEAIPLRARCCYLFAIFTGMREGELWALRWEDITLDGTRPEVIVRRSNNRETTKGGRTRTIPLLPEARSALNTLRSLGDFTTKPHDLVFPAPRGGQRSMSNDHGWGSRARRVGHRVLAGIDRRVRFHDLRSTCASHLIMGTWTPRPLEIVPAQRVLGHSDIKTTMGYAHLAPGYLHDVMNGALGQDR